MLYRPLRSLAIVLLKVLFRLKVMGRENLPRKGGYIIAGNHLSYIDPIVLGCGSPRKLYFMARRDLFEIPLLGRLLRWLDVIPLSTEGVGFGAVREALKLLARGDVVALFPEGTRSPDGLLGRGKLGVGFLALRAAVSVIPARVVGSEKALPLKAKFIRLKTIRVYFGKPLTFDSSYYGPSKRADYERASQAVMAQIAKLGETDES